VSRITVRARSSASRDAEESSSSRWTPFRT
jgi:hypothetical protein